MLPRSLAGSLLAVLFAASGQAQFEIRGARLYLDGAPFHVRGVAYSPTPIGEIAGPVLRVSGCLYWRDFPLIALAGANTVRLYARVATEDRAFWQALDASNLYVLAGFPLEPYADPGAALAGALRDRILREFRDYLETLRGRRRVIAVAFGNEVANSYNRMFSGSARDFYALLEDAAGVLRDTLGTPGPLLTTAAADVSDIGLAGLGTRDSDLPGLAFWSVNTFRGSTFGNLFEEIPYRTGKAVLVSEFGVDAFDAGRQVEDAETQAAAVRSLAGLLGAESSRSGSSVMGGVWYSFSDEWWRGGADPARHGLAGLARAGFPDGAANPAWFGLFGLLASDAAGLDSLRPRSAYRVLAEEWGITAWRPSSPPRLHPQGVVNAASRSNLVAPGGLVSFFGENLAGSPPALTSACIASRPVPQIFAESNQINGQVPWETPAGAATALVYRAGVASNVITVEVRDLAPGIFDRGVIPNARPCPVSVANGVRPGTYLEVYGTGLGASGTPLATGVAPTVPRETDTWPRASLEGRDLRVFYTGLVPRLLGVYQINTRVPEDFPPASAVSLRLLAGSVESNAYALSVLGGADRPGFTLGPSLLSFLVQAGGPAQTAELAVEGHNGFCELVRFSTAGLPDGVAASIPVGFPGQNVPVTIQAKAHARGIRDAPATITAVSLADDSPTARLRISVLPSRGDIGFRVVSGGARAGLVARFEMEGYLLHQAQGGGPGRGFNFVTLDGQSGVLSAARTFDTWASESAAEEMADYLFALAPGTVVLGAVADEGSLRLTPRAREIVRRLLGSRLIDSLRYQDSWAIIARVGSPLPFAEDLAADRQAVLDRVLTFPMP